MPDASERAATIRAAERWFEQQGLPYFVPANAEQVRSALSKSRMIPVTVVVALLVGAGAGPTTGAAATDLSLGILGGALVLGPVLGVYGLVSLHLKPIPLREWSEASLPSWDRPKSSGAQPTRSHLA